MKFLAIASFSLLLAACTAPQAPADGTASPVEPPAPVVTSETPAGKAPLAKRAPGQENVDPLQSFRAFGTEPFWNVTVQGDQLTFTTPEDQDGMVMHGQRAAAASGGLDIIGSNGGQPFTLSVRAGSCNDGMSDNQYDMTSTFNMGDIRYAGCAELAK